MRNLLRQRVLPLVALCALSSGARADVFVNELHYENASTDANEAIEVVATEGEDLTQYQVVLYNAAGTSLSQQVYDTDTVPAGDIVSCGGNVRIATIAYAVNGIQNGSPDGIALVSGTNVVQFLSYEGTFTPAFGPAAGIPSTNIGVSELDTGPATASLQLSGTDGSAYADFGWNSPATSTFGACNTGQTFGVAPDVAPTVSSTSPANNATNVAITSNLTVAFSEAVTVTGNWLSLACATSGNRAIADFAVTGGPSTFTLNATTDFSYSESCTATIAASAVADQDAPADALGANYVFTFTTAAAPVDNPPTVAAITPANNAPNVALSTTIQVTFSEAVTTNAAAFSLTCDSIAQAFTLAGSGSVYTLDPATDLPAVKTCAIAIDKAGVFDQDGTIQTMVADFLASFTTRAAGGDYYGGVDATSCSALRSTLHTTIKNHTFFPYTDDATDTWDILNTADQDPLNPANVLDVYKNESYTKITGGTGVYNREHTWPNSYGYNDRTGDEAYTDTHMLYVSNSSANSSRNNIPYDTCVPNGTASGCQVLTTSAYNGRGGGPSDNASYPGNHNWYSPTLDRFEVWNGRKGDVARAVLYMDVRYEGGTNTRGRAEPNLIVTDDRSLIVTGPSGVFQSVGYMGIKSTLLDWNKRDRPDIDEQLRNDVIESYQENRNPFIDHPEWVALAFVEPCTTASVNVAPYFVPDSTYAVLEGAAVDTPVNQFVAVDANPGQSFTYSIVSGNSGAAFAISPGGMLTVANSAAIDGAAPAPISLVVRATDNGSPPASADAAITVNVTPVNDAPSFTKGANPQHLEDAGAISLAGWASNISAGPSDEAAQALTFEVMQNDNAPLFAVAPAIASNGTLSYTVAPNASGVATLTIRVVDSGGTANGGLNASAGTQFTISVAPVNDAPTLGGGTFSIASNTPNGTFVGAVAANDVDGPSISYSIASGNTGGAFLIESDGEIRVANAAALTSPTFTLTVEASDGSATASATVTVNVTQLDDVLFLHGFE